MHSRSDLTGLVLCGGRSRRMGRDKAVLALGGTTLIERAVGVLAGIARETLIATGPEPRYPELGLECVLDRVADAGPLAGLEAGLARSRSEWTAALACDMPRVDARVIEILHDRAKERDLDACLLATRRGVEPLCAVYRRTCLEPVRAALDAGERAMVSFHAGLRVETLPEWVLPAELRERRVALNVNTLVDLVEVTELLLELP
jgi:molybdopterin-guanine dinucleotide biosynthesis protein A